MGANSIEMNLRCERLDELDLSYNDISESAVIIGGYSSWKYLKKLDLSSNKINVKSAESLARNTV